MVVVIVRKLYRDLNLKVQLFVSSSPSKSRLAKRVPASGRPRSVFVHRDSNNLVNSFSFTSNDSQTLSESKLLRILPTKLEDFEDKGCCESISNM